MRIIKSLNQFRNIFEKENVGEKEESQKDKEIQSKSSQNKEEELSDVEKKFLTNVVNLFTNIVKLHDIIGKNIIKIEPSGPDKVEKVQKESYLFEAGVISPVFRDDKDKNKVDNLIRKDETQAIAVWKKIQKANTIPDFKACIPGLINIANKKSGLKSGDIIKIAKAIMDNRQTLGLPVKFEDLIKENFSWSDYMNKIPKGVSMFLKYIIGLRNEMGLVGAFGVAASPIKVIITSYINMQQLWEKVKRENKKLAKSTKSKEQDKEDDEKEKKEQSQPEVKLPEELKNIKSKVEETEKIEGLPKEEIIEILKKGNNIDKEIDFETKDGKKIKMTVSKAIKLLRKELEGKEEKISSRLGNKIFEGGLTYQEPTGDAMSDFTVKDLWKSFFGDLDSKEEYRRTQADVEELKDLEDEGMDNLSLDVSKKPDPVVRIANIFARAHELYFNKYIPSGRPNGRVSLQTFSEYIPLGTGKSNTTPENQVTGGPYAYEKTFQIWKRGVMSICEDQSYRKIFSNLKFVVPGAEDIDNKDIAGQKKEESIYSKLNPKYKIYERNDDEDDKKIKSEGQGQILFDFMQKMIDPKKLDDFDGVRGQLMSKYFGLDVKKVKGLSEVKSKIQPIDDKEIDNVHLKWNGFPKWESFEKSLNSDFGDNFVAIILEYEENSKKENCIFFCKIEKVNNNSEAEIDKGYFCDDFASAKKLVKEINDDNKTFEAFNKIPGINTKDNINREYVKGTVYKGKIKFTKNELTFNLYGAGGAQKFNNYKFKPLKKDYDQTLQHKYWVYALNEADMSSSKKGWEKYQLYSL